MPSSQSLTSPIVAVFVLWTFYASITCFDGSGHSGTASVHYNVVTVLTIVTIVDVVER